jgi:hypothetical protein
VAGQAQRLTPSIDRLLLSRSDNFLGRIVQYNIKSILAADAVLVALILHNVHGAPAGCEAGGGVHGLEDTEAEGCGADFGDAAGVLDATAQAGEPLFAELAVLAVPGFVDEALDVEIFPVVEVFEAQDRVVQAVFSVAINTTSFGELNGDWYSVR